MIDYKKTAFNVLGLVLICATVLGTIFLGVYFWPFLIAIIFAILLEGGINYVVKKTKAPRKAVGIVFVVLVYILIGVLVYFAVSGLIREAISLSGNLPELFEDLKVRYNDVYKDTVNTINNMPDTISNKIYDIGLNLIDKLTEIINSLINGIINFVMFFPNLIIYIIVTFLATLFLVTDRRTIARYLQEIFPSKLVKKISQVVVACFKTLGKYLKAQCIIICITFTELFIAFLMLNQPYPLLLAVAVAIVDALPILGTGTVLIPWAIYSAVTGNIALGIGLIISYVIITVVRQLVEPRIVSANLGIHPFMTLITMYLGFKIFGLIGLVIGPVVMIIFKNVFAIMFETGYLKKIFVYKKESKD